MAGEAATTLGGDGNAGGAAAGAGQAAGAAAQGGASGSGAGGQAAAGTAAQSWRDSLPEDIRTNAAISSFQDVGALAKSFIHAQSLVGKKGVIVPGEKATDEEWGAFYQQIGVPAADKYEVTAPKDYKMPDEVMSQFKEQALKAGMLPKQANAILEWYSKFESESVSSKVKEIEAESRTQMEGLKKEWGDAYDKELGTAKLAVKEIGGDDFVKYLNETGMGNDVMLIRTFAKVGKLLGEDKLREGGVVSDGNQTPSEITAALSELRANGDANGLYDKNHPMHFVTLGKMEALAKRLTGGR